MCVCLSVKLVFSRLHRAHCAFQLCGLQCSRSACSETDTEIHCVRVIEAGRRSARDAELYVLQLLRIPPPPSLSHGCPLPARPATLEGNGSLLPPSTTNGTSLSLSLSLLSLFFLPSTFLIPASLTVRLPTWRLDACHNSYFHAICTLKTAAHSVETCGEAAYSQGHRMELLYL